MALYDALLYDDNDDGNKICIDRVCLCRTPTSNIEWEVFSSQDCRSISAFRLMHLIVYIDVDTHNTRTTYYIFNSNDRIKAIGSFVK